jgi:hypothetical protein
LTRPRSSMTREPTLHPYLPYRSAELVTGESAHLVAISRRDDSRAATLEELMRRLREMCRLTAFVEELEAAAASGGQDAAKRAADANTMLEGMFRRAGDDLQHLRQTIGSSLANWEIGTKEND